MRQAPIPSENNRTSRRIPLDGKTNISRILAHFRDERCYHFDGSARIRCDYLDKFLNLGKPESDEASVLGRTDEEKAGYSARKGDRFEKVGNALGIVLGALAGFLSFIPLFAAIRISRRVTSTKVLASATNALVGCAVSLIVAVAGLLLCSNYMHDALLPFGCAEVLALIVSTSVYVVYKNVLARRR